jgi:hypothetical protein
MLLPSSPRATPAGEGGQSYFEPRNPLLGHDLTTVLDGSAVRYHKGLGSRDGERPTEHLDNSLARPPP